MAALPRAVLCSIMPRTVRHRMREGARKWMGPFLGLVFMRLRRNSAYLTLLRYTEEEERSKYQTTHSMHTCSNS